VINICPFCGHWLDRPFKDGISSCGNCQRIFDDCPRHRFLAATWACRRRHILFADSVSDMYELDAAQVASLQQVIDMDLSPDEVLKFPQASQAAQVA
jgi:epoxyqueuosine reductase QueG